MAFRAAFNVAIESASASQLYEVAAAVNLLTSWAIGTIVVGLLLEAPPEFSKYLKKRWPHCLSKLGVMLVIIGVFSELPLHVRAQLVSDRLQELTEIEIARLKNPRLLNPEQVGFIVQQVSLLPKSSFDVGLPLFDLEAATLASLLVPALADGGFTPAHWPGGTPQLGTKFPAIGAVRSENIHIQVDTASVDRLFPTAEALAKVLNDVGLTAKADKGSSEANTNPNTIHILIGRKL